MRVSLINLNLVPGDAVGACIINQVRLFLRRGDEVRVFVQTEPRNLPGDVQAVTQVATLRELIDSSALERSSMQAHFQLSGLYIYHYPSRYELMESIRGLDRGTVIFYYHNVTPPALWGSQTDCELLVRSIEGIALAHYADLCITPSPFNKQDLVQRIGYDADRIFVLPLAVPLDRIAPGDPDPALIERYGVADRSVLLYIGRMAGNKRIDLLVEALAQVQQQAPGTRLLLTGDDRSAQPYREVVAAARARAEELGISDDVIWTGPVPDILPFLLLADIYVTASLHEGFGVPLIEAMAAGVPVVASRAGAMPWVLGDAGLLAEPGNAGDLAQQILALLLDPEQRREMVQRGLERARSFSLEQYEARLGEIVDQALAYALPRGRLEDVGGDRSPGSGEATRTGGRDDLLLAFLAGEIDSRSDVAIRDYVVRSQVPLVGQLIAWTRRNLTSHLREPYLDPIVEHQVAFNRRAAEWFRRGAAAWNRSAQQQAELEARVQALEAEVEALRCSLGEEQT